MKTEEEIKEKLALLESTANRTMLQSACIGTLKWVLGYEAIDKKPCFNDSDIRKPEWEPCANIL